MDGVESNALVDVAVDSGDAGESPGAGEQRRVTQRFGIRAEFWDDVYQRSDVFARVHQWRLWLALALIERLGMPEGTRVLEVGCGAGHTAVALAQRGFQVEAIDPTPALLQIAGQHAAEAGVAARVRTLLGDAHQLPVEAASVPLVVALGVIPWLHLPALALQEMARVLKPGGYLVVNADHRHRFTFLFDPLRNPLLEPLRRAAKRVLGAVGLWQPRPEGVPVTYHTIAEFDRLVAAAGLERLYGSTYGFGPFTMFGRSVLPQRLGVRVHLWLQGLADRRVPLLRSAGAQYLVVVRKPERLHEPPTEQQQ